MKSIIESIIGKKGSKTRDIWYKNEPKLSMKEIEGDIEDCLGNIRDNNNYLRSMYDPEVRYVDYVVDVLNIIARCKDNKISDLAVDYLRNKPDTELFKGIIEIAKAMKIW